LFGGKKTKLDEFLENAQNDAWWEELREEVLCSDPRQPEATIKIVASDLGKSKTGKNDKSMVMSLEIEGRQKMLFMGDFESAYNSLLYPIPSPSHTDMEGNPINIPSHPTNYVDHIRNHQIVMVPHHGSSTMGNPNARFYNEVNPTFAIVSSAILSSNKDTKSPKIETLQAICLGHTVTADAGYADFTLPIGWATYNPICEPRDSCDSGSGSEPDSSESEDVPEECIYQHESDYCYDSDVTDFTHTTTTTNPPPKFLETYPVLQKLKNCDVHIYQTSKPRFNANNHLNSLRLFMIATRISATTTCVKAIQYGGDIKI